MAVGLFKVLPPEGATRLRLNFDVLPQGLIGPTVKGLCSQPYYPGDCSLNFKEQDFSSFVTLRVDSPNRTSL